MSILLTYYLTMNDRKQDLNQALEAMHFGFRAMVYKPDQRLAKLNYSRIHHRILYFIGQNKACNVTELLQILAVSKQYLNRPLRTLIEDGYVLQQKDSLDKRIKRLSLTDKGQKLEQDLSGQQRKRFAEIFEQVGPEAEQHWHQVMHLLSRKE